jgi:hypothetical protein
VLIVCLLRNKNPQTSKTKSIYSAKDTHTFSNQTMAEMYFKKEAEN